MPRKKSPSPAYEVSDRVAAQARTVPYRRPPGAPLTRPLRIYTLDPSVSHRIGGVATVQVPYEDLEPGPAGALFEIDGAGAPEPLKAEELDLEHPHLLLSAGHAPSPANGQFHMQMAYAVCSLTYSAFRRALGRDIAWAVTPRDGDSGPLRLRVRPFAMRERNAYYDRDEGGLAFGYFRTGANPAGHTVPKGLIFTGLSHDVIVHETTHALLDALRSQFYAPTHPDVLGFHEGFADLVALFLHFSYPDVVEQAMRECRGNLTHAGLLSELAQEFGHATSPAGRPSALRTALDVQGLAAFDSDAFLPGAKRPLAYSPDLEEHALGSVLVSAVFEAFTTIYRRKSERLLNLAGIAPAELGQRQIGGELARALAQEASDLADQFLNICIRAVDYCPPLDMSLGDYLRALITADAELVGRDTWGYREALMRSFRRRQMFPRHVNFMSEDAVKWQAPAKALRIPGLAFRDLRFNGDPGQPADAGELRRQADALGSFVSAPANAPLFRLVAPGAALPKGVEYASLPRVESVRCARRVAPDGRIVFDLVAEVLQSGTVRLKGELFDFSGGCTMVIDPEGAVRYVIHRRLDSVERQARQLAALRGRLKRYWKKEKGRYVPHPGMLRLLHGIAPSGRGLKRPSRKT
jgi:hypothetical protein